MKLKKGDKVRVMAGKDHGRNGVIEKVYKKQNKVLILGINQYKKHIKKSEKVPRGGVVELSRPIDVSKLAFVCAHCASITRVGYAIKQNKKQRICKKCKEKI